MQIPNRWAVPAWTAALAVFLVTGAVWCAAQVLDHQRQLASRGQLDLGERVMDAKLALWREEALTGAVQTSRDTVLLRALQSGHREALEGALAAGMRKASAQRIIWFSSRAEGKLELLAPDARAKDAPLGALALKLLRELSDEALRQGKAQQVIYQGAEQVWSVGAAQLPNETGVVVLMLELPKRIERESVALGLDLRLTARAKDKPEDTASGDTLVRTLYVPEASTRTLAVEIRPASKPVQGIDYPVLGIAGLVLGGLGLAYGLWWSSQQPLRQLGRVVQQLSSTPERSARQLEISDPDPIWQALSSALGGVVEVLGKREAHWRQLALNDPLTTLPNAAMLSERLGKVMQQATRAQKPVSVLRIDLEEFRTLNASFGYAAGDQMLREVGERIRSLLRGANSPARHRTADLSQTDAEWLQPVVGRLGGDDFIALLPDCDADQAQRVAARVIDALGRPFSIEGQQYWVKTHVGVASAPEHALDSILLLRAAETALASARAAQRSAVVYNLDHEKQRQQQLSLLAELRQALLGNELLLMYQPKVDLSNSERLRVEALLRWEHPERGLQSPAEFVPFAERTGFIVEVTRWVIDQALRQVMAWRKQGLDVQIGVNLAVADVRNADFPTYVIERLRFYQLPPDCLTVEISEAALGSEPELVRNCLQVLDRYGVKLAIDDFSGGASALAYLDDLPVSVVKIERALIAGMMLDAARQTLVRSSIEFAHQRGLQVMAEGVENAATLQLLRDFQCDFAQGYYFGKPLPADAYPAWVQHQARRFQASSGNFTELAVGI